MRRAPKPSDAKTAYRVVSEKSSTSAQLQRSMEALRKQLVDEFGRPDVPSEVRHAVCDYARMHGLSLRGALDTLIAQASSYEALKMQFRKKLRKLQKKSDRLREGRKAGQQEPRGSEYKVTVFFQGGAPGLGKARNGRKNGPA